MSTTTRKRALLSENSAEEPSGRRSKVSYAVLENELHSLRSELEHERSLREIDARRSQQSVSRLERQLQFVSEEAEEAKQLLEEVRSESEQHMNILRQKRKEALEELRECQDQLAEGPPEDDYELQLCKKNTAQVEAKLQARTEEVQALREKLEQIISEQQRQAQSPVRVAKDSEARAETSSPAPKAVLQELNKVRIAFAESERKYRQLKRKSEDWQQKAQLYVQQKETAASAKLRVGALETEIMELRIEAENRRATNQRWDEFASELGSLLKGSTTGGPPEVSAVMRHLQKEINTTKTVQSQNTALKKNIEESAKKIADLEKQIRDANTMHSRSERNIKLLRTELEETKLQVQALRAQELIWQREADSLRSLVKTFDDMLPNQPTNAANQALELALSTARDENKVIKLERDRLMSNLESVSDAKQAVEKEHDTVRDKFVKLRDALMEERAKAEKAEERAMHAEALAGKGQFNPERTRALHLEKNPLFDAMKERYQSEINVLKKKVEEITGEKPADRAQAAVEVDPEKLHQRLKDTFKEQIGLFREGVYLITGYKIDMLLDMASPYFKVRSVYGEREDDFLIFNWPKGVKQPKNLDIRATDFAKMLSTTDAYEYLKRYDSMPGFMAATQLSLLEKCTFVGQPSST